MFILEGWVKERRVASERCDKSNIDQGSCHLEMEKARLFIIRRNGTDGAPFPVLSEITTFGRSEDCDIRLFLPEVSRLHARLVFENGQVWNYLVI